MEVERKGRWGGDKGRKTTKRGDEVEEMKAATWRWMMCNGGGGVEPGGSRRITDLQTLRSQLSRRVLIGPSETVSLGHWFPLHQRLCKPLLPVSRLRSPPSPALNQPLALRLRDKLLIRSLHAGLINPGGLRSGGVGWSPDPNIPDPSIPDPSIPDPSIPDPSIPDPSIQQRVWIILKPRSTFYLRCVQWLSSNLQSGGFQKWRWYKIQDFIYTSTLHDWSPAVIMRSCYTADGLQGVTHCTVFDQENPPDQYDSWLDGVTGGRRSRTDPPAAAEQH